MHTHPGTASVPRRPTPGGDPAEHRARTGVTTMPPAAPAMPTVAVTREVRR
ncbi:hypothetical protein Sgleb_12550 [Streptomyces glebosus]|uniref:Uncharacterized protein n=1 Tax=Streptomyces glebosus TaxID=249580 RepID=A0A640SQ41_9ACTN|nr:hypothetical protein Sgleb_12550 [Streptomyces glebosus]GHG78700.1 hypothetical protein GCM10010513_55500 [Streptomyces glebosus]